MAADFGFVAHAAKGDAHELAAKRLGDARQARFYPPRGADEAEDRTFDVAASLMTARNSIRRSLTFSRPK